MSVKMHCRHCQKVLPNLKTCSSYTWQVRPFLFKNLTISKKTPSKVTDIASFYLLSTGIQWFVEGYENKQSVLTRETFDTAMDKCIVTRKFDSEVILWHFHFVFVI